MIIMSDVFGGRFVFVLVAILIDATALSGFAG